MSFNWQCPFCGNHQTVVNNRYHSDSAPVKVGKTKHGNYHNVSYDAISCANAQCGEIHLNVQLCSNPYPTDHIYFNRNNNGTISAVRLRPRSIAKPQPDCIPEHIRDDYYEASLIIDGSSKAAATLARRALQTMIRDFAGISKTSLYREIEELRKLLKEDNLPKGVSEESIEALDDARAIATIAAHPERDVSIIVDIDTDEAVELIELVEMLFEEWYLAREKRQTRLSKLKATRVAKKEAREPASPVVKPAPVTKPE